MPNNKFSFINFELLELYWTYFLALQTTTPKILLMRLMSLDHEPKKRWCAMSLNHGLWCLFFFFFWMCKYGLFWDLEEIFPKSMKVLTWCRSPMKWSRVVWKICPQQWLTFLSIKFRGHSSKKKQKSFFISYLTVKIEVY